MTDMPISGSDPRCAMTVEDAQLLLHDLRAPMTAIVGYASMLRRTHEAADRDHIVDALDRAVKRMDAMLEAAARGELRPGARAEAFSPVDVCLLVAEAAQDVEASWAVTVNERCAEPAVVLGDPGLLRRALDNLLSNAVRYGGGGPVDVEVDAGDDVVSVEVSDRGPGIPAQDRQRVLLPMERLARDAGSPGTGLGLSVVASVAEAHGGSVTILERDGGGTTVRLELRAL